MKFCSDDIEIRFSMPNPGYVIIIYTDKKTGKDFCRHRMSKSDAESEQISLAYNKEYKIIL